jgi:hypothetical protein
MTPEEKSAWNRAYYLRNRQKILERASAFHAANRDKYLQYQAQYYQQVTKTVRQGKGATTLIKGVASRRKNDKIAATPRHYKWSNDRLAIRPGFTLDWAS